MKKYFIAALMMTLAVPATWGSRHYDWPVATREMKPWVYNWWMANAVDEEGLEYQCNELEEKGFGGFHVIPIYGANDTDKEYRNMWRRFLSEEWLEVWNLAALKADEHNLGIDLTMGSGWCFGGPWITEELGASSGAKVKRACPGGEGLMIDPYNPEAMKVHIAVFEPYFGKNGKARRPRAFYHDSWEYYNATPRDTTVDIDEAVINTFKVWTEWCRDNGYLTRNEAHGSTANWIDFYALADIPETEMDFKRKNPDILISKFASSAAHIKGSPLVSAETCTWIDEHFHESPTKIKMFIDRLFLAGVNHIFYHGLCYSPIDTVWPGWCFYASCEMNPRNPIWQEMEALNTYVTRCQSLFQTWTSDNDLLLLWNPDDFRQKTGNKYIEMSNTGRDWFYGENIGNWAKRLYDEGYAFDYVSPRLLSQHTLSNYSACIDTKDSIAEEININNVRTMPFAPAKNGLMATRWRKDGQTMYFVVNQQQENQVISSSKAFVVMNPLTGVIEETDSVVIPSNHSLFLIGDSFNVRTVQTEEQSCLTQFDGEWIATPIAGGPNLGNPIIMVTKEDGTLDGWEVSDDAFSGTMLYHSSFDVSSILKSKDCNVQYLLDLGDVHEIARVRINGEDIGVRFMKPYRFNVPYGLLKEKNNMIEVEVTNLGANRIRWNDINGVEWKYFTDANVKSPNYKPLDARTWKVLKSGLIGPVRLF